MSEACYPYDELFYRFIRFNSKYSRRLYLRRYNLSYKPVIHLQLDNPIKSIPVNANPPYFKQKYPNLKSLRCITLKCKRYTPRYNPVIHPSSKTRRNPHFIKMERYTPRYTLSSPTN